MGRGIFNSSRPAECSASRRGPCDRVAAEAMIEPLAEVEEATPEYLALLEAEVALKEGLPHLHGFPWYAWAHDFFETQNKMAFLCAANQISKSSTQIRKCIHWATDKTLWPKLWPRAGLPPPNQFWYVYPTSPLSTVEFETKWRRDFLPRGKYEHSKEYGWKAHYKNKEIERLEFNSGVTVYFKSYKQGGFNLQSATVYAIFLDEECPAEMWDEFVFRLNATDGYLSMVFTATLGQEEWRAVIEPVNDEDEKYPNAWKRQISIYECQTYMDGTAGPWNEERINNAIAKCSTAAQVQRRILGKFVKESGLIYEQFDVKRHMVMPTDIPKSWLWYVAADIGSGRTEQKGQGHPGGVVVAAVRPDFKVGRVVHCWRGDNMRTTAGDIYNRAEEIIADLGITPMAKLYDWGSADFGTISTRNGAGWRPANKSHADGEQALNTLFKHDMFAIFQKGQNGKLAGELCSVNHETPKRKRKDDLIDPTRYIAVEVPWDWTAIAAGGSHSEELVKKPKLTIEQQDMLARRGEMMDEDRPTDFAEMDAEFSEMNRLYEGT